jgi:UDP-N-acetylmuramate dehydrogenase
MEITEKTVKQICEKANAEIIFNESLKNHNTFSVGGRCKAFISINSENLLAELVKFLNENGEKYFILGKGSNVIVSDTGYDGYVLCMGKNFEDINMTDEVSFSAKAGLSMAKLGNFALKNSLCGAEGLHGIPGTIGGAVYMNAGAYGQEISDIVTKVRAIDKNGNIKEYTADELDFSYRHSVFSENKEIVSEVFFKMKKDDASLIKSRMQECMQKRKDKQPLEYPSAGSTFKRPDGSYASLLIDNCGLKGMSVGDAQVSEKHCGFVVNKGNATSKDIMSLCKKVSEIVKEKTGYSLELEPVVLGNI